MGDVPFIKAATYRRLINQLSNHHMVVLGFIPEHKKQYGVLETRKGCVAKIIEWKYWKEYPVEKQTNLQICNSGIYAARSDDFIRYLNVLQSKPQIVVKERDGHMIEIEEYFITDIVELMNHDGLSIGYVLADDEHETMGIDDLSALVQAQALYSSTLVRQT
jgi:bifunctional UDP-N-acetylglucosamine pyrophosphorylase/glucosamine-1-phosphate N-acetyltransferase